MSITAVDVALALIGLFLLYTIFSRKVSTPLPPGPKKWPLLGNLLDMPSSKEWVTFAEWGAKWGDMVLVSVFGQQFIIVNSVKTATEMLEKKSALYSDRPVMEMGGELVGWKNALVLVPYGQRFRNYRKLFHQLIGTHSSMAQFLPIEEIETHRFLKRVLEHPNDLATHIRKTAGAIILRISHGYEVKANNDPFVHLAELATDQFSLATAPGAFLVNLIPALSKLPSWFPGTGFKQTAKAWAKTLHDMAEEPYQFVKTQMAAGVADVSFTSKLLTEPDMTPEREFEIKWSAASLYAGGADTTVSAIYSFFKAMILYPEVQLKAQAEIDTVIGTGRLPAFSDWDQLPYLNAVMLEALRWHCVAPTAVPHRVTEDNIHNGYLIPKGALIIPNVWNMLHDPEVYSDPMTFNPDRFLGPSPEEDPRSACFGFGRRICPGKVLAEASIFISCAMTLAVFNIAKAVENGQVIEPDREQKPGVISHPTDFKCTITPRSAKAVTLINAAE